MSEITNYIKNKILEAVPDADVRDGSALNDLLISPLSSVLDPFITEQRNLLVYLSDNDPESIPDDVLDGIASNFFVTRITGDQITGTVRIYFDRPVDLEVPQNTVFTATNGLRYFSTTTNSITRADMAINVEGALYHSGDIVIEAEEAGEAYEAPANTITSVGTVSQTPVRVRNPQPLVTNNTRETNTQLVERIQETFVTSSLSSKKSIEKMIKANFSAIRDVEVVGAGDIRMTRDVLSVPSERIANYFGKRPGFTQYPDIPSVAYFKRHNIFADVTSGTNLPQPSDFENEFISYVNIWRNDTSSYLTEDIREIETESFTGEDWLVSGLGTGTYVNPGWRLTDTALGTDKYNPFAFSFGSDAEGRFIRLGQQSNDIPANTQLDLFVIAELVTVLQNIQDGYNDLIDVVEIGRLLGQLQDAQNPEIIFDYYPVFHRYISLNAGIAITGRFRTTAPTSSTQMSYITTYRTTDAIAPHDGFGIAWKPGAGDEYNVYVVDNNVLQDDIWVGKNMITQDYGINNFLHAARATILPNTWYNFRIEIDDDHSIDTWIKPVASGVIDPTEGGDAAILRYGPTFNDKPVAATQGNNFGISVGGTKNQEWHYGDIGIKVIDDNYPVHLFKVFLDEQYFSTDELLYINYYGIGEGLDGAVVADNSVQLYVYNYNTSYWDYLGGHDNDITGDIQVYTASGIVPTTVKTLPHVVVETPGNANNNIMYLLAVADTPNQADHALKTHYVEVVGAKGNHVGNYVDIYVDSPDNMAISTETGTVTNGSFTFTGAGPVQEIIEVIVGDPGDELILSLEQDEWSVQYAGSGDAFSSTGVVRIIPDPAIVSTDVTISVTYRYLSIGGSIQNLVDSDEYRQPSQNNLVKVMPPHVIEFRNFIYKGNVQPSEMQTKFKEYINSSELKSINISDLISKAIEFGANSVDTTDIEIYVKYSNLEGRQSIQQVASSYSITGMGYFYTDEINMAGISQ